MLNDLSRKYTIAENRHDEAEMRRVFSEAITQARAELRDTICDVPAVFAPVLAAAMINCVLDLAEQNELPLKQLYEFAYLSEKVDSEALAEAVRIGNELM